ncbi:MULTISPECIES: DUF3298 and DUF4163 domain-containing protein [unclassified Lysobacter]|uniref:DUF3298 and DUF4163 domain-containing protein n=1 Tax=unclassified Lysobacter TaxID=2635362 RepID=UPI001C237C54|nr:DUF3298 and DUF4163 domain-containing protein [Lysobacter sp. MMG2]MBU8978100.1 DUF3298 and DUF4163 domain-containing protein [Lysobacter sp. MMG2]
MKRLLLLFALAAALSACKRDPEPAAPIATAPGTAPAVPGEPAGAAPGVTLQDVSETTSDYIIGISYQVPAEQYPGLAVELKKYADAAREDLIEAAKARAQPGGATSAPYDLSLSFTELMHTPEVVAIAADGSSYTGGAHGAPLIARFVWLPKQNRMLGAQQLIPTPAGWSAISDYVREQLHAALSQRVDADDLPPEERAEVVKNASRMIDDGTQPDPADFALFEPMASPDGRLGGLRFVFAPYQVGPYSDGTQTVEVPVEILLPHIAPEYRALFAAPVPAPADPAGAPATPR